MLILRTTDKFRTDYKLAKKRGLPMEELEIVLQTLLEERPLEKKHRDHALSGNYIGFRECHIRPNWLLIYTIDHGNLILTAARTGSHSDLLE